MAVSKKSSNLVLDTRVLSLSIFTDKDSVHIFVRGLITLDGYAWTHVSEEIEGAAKCQV